MLLRTVAVVALLACTGMAQAQTLGDVLDQGGRKLTPAEAQALLPMSFIRDTRDAEAQITLRPDGTVTGLVANKEGHGTSEAAGTWTMGADGKRCVDVKLPAFRMDWKECNYPFVAGSQLFSVLSDSDRSAKATAFVMTAYIRQ